ncbi:MAG: tRNA-specific 2-thiouridylase MnmA, partial [Candidatus Hydrogenedentes bacterium]|nr:tRNA-specific 2-thiouridylase MnmA [Candidatus Hydrogenedentota bacterium]
NPIHNRNRAPGGSRLGRAMPPTTPSIAVAMSGGVDSSVAAALLIEQGFSVIGLTLRVIPGPSSENTITAARSVAQYLGIPHHVADVVDRFEEQVIAEFTREYLVGRTPNPCVRCNQRIKFGFLLDQALALDAEALATGHYARRIEREGRVTVQRATYRAKDQSYVLAALRQDQLERARFPLGGLSKDETRERARAFGLPSAEHAESQEICFVPGDDYGRFLIERTAPPAPGPILSLSGETLGQHKGLFHYTVGQRRGLGISSPRPYYVVRLDFGRNALFVGHEEETYCAELEASEVNWCGIPPQTAPFDCLAQVRYRHTATPVTVTPREDGITVHFHQPQRSIAPGQWVVLYDHEDCALAAALIQTFTPQTT